MPQNCQNNKVQSLKLTIIEKYLVPNAVSSSRNATNQAQLSRETRCEKEVYFIP